MTAQLCGALLLLDVFAASLAQVTGSYSVQVTPTGSIDFAAATNIASYPKCAATCEQQSFACPGGDPKCLCGPDNRGNTTTCEYLTCNDEEYQQTVNKLAPDACSPFYEADPELASSVSVAIGSATAAAKNTLEKTNVNDLSTYPECGQKCIPPALKAGGCTGITDRACVCHCPITSYVASDCERTACSNDNVDDELNAIINVINALCAPEGGILDQRQSACRVNQTVGTATSGSAGPSKPTGSASPPIEPFQGEAAGKQGHILALPACVMIALGIGAVV